MYGIDLEDCPGHSMAYLGADGKWTACYPDPRLLFADRNAADLHAATLSGTSASLPLDLEAFASGAVVVVGPLTYHETTGDEPTDAD